MTILGRLTAFCILSAVRPMCRSRTQRPKTRRRRRRKKRSRSGNEADIAMMNSNKKIRKTVSTSSIKGLRSNDYQTAESTQSDTFNTTNSQANMNNNSINSNKNNIKNKIVHLGRKKRIRKLRAHIWAKRMRMNGTEKHSAKGTHIRSYIQENSVGKCLADMCKQFTCTIRKDRSRAKLIYFYTLIYLLLNRGGKRGRKLLTLSADSFIEQFITLIPPDELNVGLLVR